MNVNAVAESNLRDNRRERRPAAAAPRHIAHHLTQDQCPIGTFETECGPTIYLVLRRPAFGLEGLGLLTGCAQGGDHLRTEIGGQLVGDQRIVGARQIGQAVEEEFLFERREDREAEFIPKRSERPPEKRPQASHPRATVRVDPVARDEMKRRLVRPQVGPRSRRGIRQQTDIAHRPPRVLRQGGKRGERLGDRHPADARGFARLQVGERNTAAAR